jgi:gliding motility-associated-like protein
MNPKKIVLLTAFLMTFSVVAQEGNNRRGCLDELDIPESIGICGDGVNTTWGVHFPCAPEKFRIAIYNRWGNLIFESEDYRFGWLPVDDKKNPLAPGVYLFNLEYTHEGQEKLVTGNVTVVC